MHKHNKRKHNKRVEITSHERHGVQILRQHEYVLNSLFKITTAEIIKHRNVGHLWSMDSPPIYQRIRGCILQILWRHNFAHATLTLWSWHGREYHMFDHLNKKIPQKWNLKNADFKCELINYMNPSGHRYYKTNIRVVKVHIAGPPVTKKTPSYGYRDPHYKPKTVWRPSQVYNGNPYTDKTASS